MTVPPSPAIAALKAQLEHECQKAGLTGGGDDVRLACWMLTVTQPWPDAAGSTMQALLDAHRDGVMDAATWRRLRKAAVALGESDDHEIRQFGKVAEAAAWPLSTSEAGLVELMREVGYLRAAQASASSGWTREDEAEAHGLLNAIAAGNGTSVPAREEIPGIFNAAHPELGRRFVVQLELSNATFLGFRREVAAWLAGAAV